MKAEGNNNSIITCQNLLVSQIDVDDEGCDAQKEWRRYL